MRREERLGMPGGFVEGTTRRVVVLVQTLRGTWNGVPSGPNCTLFSGVDRLADALRDRSKIGWSPTPHAPVLGALQRALDRNLRQIMCK